MQAISKGYLQASGGHVHLEFSSRYQSPPPAVVTGHQQRTHKKAGNQAANQQ